MNKKTLLKLAIGITATAASTSLALSTLPNPTELQKQLGDTANTIAIAGATAIFGVLDEQDEGKRDDED